MGLLFLSLALPPFFIRREGFHHSFFQPLTETFTKCLNLSSLLRLTERQHDDAVAHTVSVRMCVKKRTLSIQRKFGI